MSLASRKWLFLLLFGAMLTSCKIVDNRIEGNLPSLVNQLQFESVADGSGQPYSSGSLTLRMGEHFEIHSVLRDPWSDFLGTIDVNWSVLGLNIFGSTSTSLEVGSMTPGAKSIQATTAEGLSVTLNLTVEPIQVLETNLSGMLNSGAYFRADHDLDGDGYNEFVVSNVSYDANRGRVEVYSGATRELKYFLEGEFSDVTDVMSTGNRFGWFLQYIGDISGDGNMDLLISPISFTGSSGGKVYAVSGDTGAILYTIEKSVMWFGWKVQIIPDINSDGAPDFLVPSYNDNTHRGKIWVYSGATGSEIYTLQGASSLDMFGYSVLIMDSDGDGNYTMYVSAVGVGNYGRLYSYNLTTGVNTGSYTGTLTYPVKTLIEAPDVNGDGHKDMYSGLGGTSTYNNKALFSGANVQPIGAAFVEEVVNTSFGSYYSKIDDVNGDSVGDVVIAATQFGSNTGKVYVYSAANQALLYSLTGEAAGNNFGSVNKSLGDINGDGRGDILVVAANYDSNRGKIYVYSGASGALLFSLSGENQGDNFSFGFLQDFNGDGVKDIVANSGSFDSSRGKSYVYSGTNGVLLFSISGQALGDQFRVYSVDHDFNGDGIKDLVASAPGYDSSRGRAYVFSGANGTSIREFQGDLAGEQLGTRVLTTDLEGSGNPQVILGAPAANSGNGKIYFLF